MNEFFFRMRGLFILLAAVAGLAHAADSNSDNSALDSLQAYLDSLNSLQAKFEQVLFDADSQQIQRSSGTLRLLRPGRFRWDYSEPFEQTIVADGKQLWIYDADLEQVTRRTLDTGLDSTPAMLLSGDGRVAEGYTLKSSFIADGISWAELVPRQRDTDFRLVRLGFAEGQLTSMDLVDSLNQTTRISFSEINNSLQLDPAEFRFVPPAGTDIIGEDDF